MKVKPHPHIGVRRPENLTRGERGADIMKTALATWTALGLVVVVILLWIATAGFGFDARPFILLNLCLSCFAALQCFVLLIANKRGEQISAEISLHTYQNTQQLTQLVEDNTKLTSQIHDLTKTIHEMLESHEQH